MSGTKLELVEGGTVPLSERSDDELMALFAADYSPAARVLVERHETKVYLFARRYLGDPALAEEAAQETFVRVWWARAEYRASGRFCAYLAGLCLNVCRELSRGRDRRKRS